MAGEGKTAYGYQRHESKIRPYTEIATAIARNGGSLTAEEKNSLIAMSLHFRILSRYIVSRESIF